MVNPKDTTRYSNVVGSRYGYDKTGQRRTGISCAGIQAYGDMRMVHYSILNRVFRHVG